MCSIIGRLQTTEEHRRKEPLTTEFRCFANYPGSSNLVGRGTLYILPVYQPSLLLLLLLLGFESPPLSRASLYRAPSRETIVSQESLSLSLSLSILPMATWDYRSDHRARCDCTVLLFQRASSSRSPRGGLKRSEQEFARVPVCEKSIGPCNELFSLFFFPSPPEFSSRWNQSLLEPDPDFSSYTLSNVQREREKERGETFVREWFNSRELCSR